MLKTLGRSVYLTQFEEQRASLSAFAAGGAPVFISLHISEEFDAAYCARVQEMCDFLSAQGWRILADVSEKTIRQFGCADLTALAKRLHLWGLRLDYGFSLEEMCALAQQLPVAVNASTTTPEVARQLAAGGGTVIAMHNFYPRPETGLDPEFLRESTAALQAEALISMTDVVGLLRNKNDESSLIHRVYISDTPALIADGIIGGGMIPKIDSMTEALRRGVKKAFIIDGRVPHSILMELLTDEGMGTMFRSR